MTKAGGEYSISSDNYLRSEGTGTEGDNKPTWIFKNNITVTNQKNKGYGAGTENRVKYSAGTQFTVNIPGESVRKVKINGYDNYTDQDAYLAELNGATFNATDYVFPKKESKDAPGIIKEYTIDLETAANGTLTFTPGGKQVAWAITLYTLPEVTLNEQSVAFGIDGQQANVTLIRTLSDTYWNSFCVPFDITAEMIKEVFGGAEIGEFAAVNGNTMIFRDGATEIKAGAPYVIKPLKKVENPRFEGVRIVNGELGRVVIDGCEYIGTYTKYAMAYGGSELMLNTRNGLSRPQAAPNNVMRGMRAFFRLPAGYATQAKVMMPDEATAITEVNDATETKTRKGIYNLNGQLAGYSTESLPNGIYISGGRKIIIRNK